jgi:hypothetical protein
MEKMKDEKMKVEIKEKIKELRKDNQEVKRAIGRLREEIKKKRNGRKKKAAYVRE